MKKTLLTLAIALMAVFTAKAQKTSVNINVAGTVDTTQIGLQLIDGKNDSPTFMAPSHGTGTISLDIPAGNDGRGYYIIVNGQNLGVPVLLMPGEQAVVSGTVKRSKTGFYTIENLDIQSATTKDYQRRQLNRDSLNVLYEAYHRNPTFKDYEKATAAKDTAKINAIMKTDGWKKFTADESAFFHVVDSTFKAVHRANAGTWFGPFMILTDYSYLTQQQQPEYDQLSDAAKNSFYGRIVRDQVVPPSVAGKTVPNFTFTDHNTGKATSLKEVLARNKYVLIDFWASWCRPCRMEIPNVKANYEKYHAQGFDVVSISADDKEANWLKALSEEKMPWPQGWDADDKLQELYDITYYPTTFLVDHNGQVVAKDVRGQALGKKLEEVMK